MSFHSLVIPRHSHLKWKALDPLEGILMALCGVSIGGFTLSVFCDVVTREIGAPWLWLQLVTTVLKLLPLLASGAAVPGAGFLCPTVPGPRGGGPAGPDRD